MGNLVRKELVLFWKEILKLNGAIFNGITAIENFGWLSDAPCAYGTRGPESIRRIFSIFA